MESIREPSAGYPVAMAREHRSDEMPSVPSGEGSRWRKWAVLGLQGGATAFGILSGGGVLVHALMSRSERRRFTPPGRMLRVNGHDMHVLGAGEGSPTVVLEAGPSGYSGMWEWVQGEVSRKTRVISYDRAGLGYSERASGARDAVTMARDLDQALGLAGEKPPFILAGHSFGGLLVLKYAHLFPDKVAGVVLIDPFHPDQVAQNPELRRLTTNAKNLLHLASMASHLGIMRLTDAISGMTEGLSENEKARGKAFLATARHLKASARELDAWKETANQTRSVHLGDIPLLVLSAGAPQLPWVEDFQKLHQLMTSLSNRSAHRVVPGVDHLTMVTRHENASQVSQAILEVVEYARQGPPGIRT